MKYILSIAFLFTGLLSYGQSKDFRTVMSNARLLEDIVFRTKDSAGLASLFADPLHYEHSGGKVQSREEAIQGISHNKSTYLISLEPHPYDVSNAGDSIMVKHLFKATEKKADGSEVNLDLTIITVWIKEHKQWKLSRRKAIKN